MYVRNESFLKILKLNETLLIIDKNRIVSKTMLQGFFNSTFRPLSACKCAKLNGQWDTEPLYILAFKSIPLLFIVNYAKNLKLTHKSTSLKFYFNFAQNQAKEVDQWIKETQYSI